MTNVVISDTKGQKYLVGSWTIAEMGDDGNERAPYIMKNAVKRVFKGENRSGRIDVHGKGWDKCRFRAGEIADGCFYVGCRVFDRAATLVIRGWAFE